MSSLSKSPGPQTRSLLYAVRVEFNPKALGWVGKKKRKQIFKAFQLKR